MINLGYYNGRYALLEEMTIPILDRSITFGDALYDSLYTKNHIPYELDLHINRFFSNAEKLKINLPYSKSKLNETVNSLIKRVDCDEQFIYIQASRGTQIRDHSYDKNLNANLLIMISPKSIRPINKKMSIMSAIDLRHAYCNYKTVNLFHNVITSTEAKESGFDEVVFVKDNFITECAHSNISILKNNVFITAPISEYVLGGIARQNLLNNCIKFGIEIDIRKFTLDEMMSADEVILSSSGCLCTEIEKIDKILVGGKDKINLTKLQNAAIQDFLAKTSPAGIVNK
jgi:D-alanine transaminase